MSHWLADQPSNDSPRDVVHGCDGDLVEALRPWRANADSVEGRAAEAVVSRSARVLAKSLAEILEREETSSIGLSLESLLECSQHDAALPALHATPSESLPAVVRGAMGAHRALWTTLDQIAAQLDPVPEAER